MKFTPRHYQEVAIDHAVDFLLTATPTQRQLYAAPTGSGKSVVELCVQKRVPGSWIVSPREEIIYGMMDKLGVSGDSLDHRISTPIRLRNRLMAGKLSTPTALIVDETHHETAETYRQLDLLSGMCPAVGYTASPYRGSPRGTKELLDRWGEPAWIITYEEAVAEGFMSMPTFEVLPLVDDDIVAVKNGEFDVTSLDGVTVDRLGDLVEHARAWHDGVFWDRATVFAVPSTLCAVELSQALRDAGMPAGMVVADTHPDIRRQYFEATEKRVIALVHINVVSEGVDLRLRRLVDLAPTMSPVKWVQHLGRITRPVDEGELPPHYVCLAEDTPVLTDGGWKRIQDVSLSDYLWDGEEWVSHDGVVCNGVRDCVMVEGVEMTKDHKILTEEGMVEACRVLDKSIPCALGMYTMAGRFVVSPTLRGCATVSANAGSFCESTRTTSSEERRRDVETVDTFCSEILGPNVALTAGQRSTLLNSGLPSVMPSAGAQTRDTLNTNITVAEVSEYISRGSTTLSGSSNTSYLSRGVSRKGSSSTEKTTTGTTSLVTYGSSRRGSPTSTRVAVYDVVNAGPRNRFQAGPLIVSNCTNRNILRHSYILDGVVPFRAIKDSEALFPASQRGHSRVLGLEAIGRFKPVPVKLLSGVNMYMYNLSTVFEKQVLEYCVIVHPLMQPVWASKVNTVDADGAKQWGTWKECPPPNDLTGFNSQPPSPMSPKQAAWWERSAGNFGLDPKQDVNRKNFQALPVLADLGVRFK